MMLLGAMFLGEQLTLRKWMLGSLGFAGAMLILQPDGQMSMLGSVFVLVSALSYAAAAVVTRVLTRQDSSGVTSLCTNVMLLACGLLGLNVHGWIEIAGSDFFVCCFLGLAGGLSNILFVMAFKKSDVSQVAALDYTVYLWAIIFGVVLFAEAPTVAAICGAILVMISGYFVARADVKTPA